MILIFLAFKTKMTLAETYTHTNRTTHRKLYVGKLFEHCNVSFQNEVSL